MPHFMDVHRNLDGVTAADVRDAHLRDVEVQDHHGVCYHKYWFNEETGTIFCLVEGPDEETCEAVHREAHGLVAEDIIPVAPELVEAFLGGGRESEGEARRPDGSLDPASRVILATRVENLHDVAARLGDGRALELIRAHNDVVRDALGKCSGREARSTGEGLLASFATASGAIRCAIAIQEAVATHSPRDGIPAPRIGIGVTAGEPVEGEESLFGVSVNLAGRISDRAEAGQILISSGVRELALGRGFRFRDHGAAHVHGFTDPVDLYTVEWRHRDAPAPAEGDAGEGRLRSRVVAATDRAGAMLTEMKRRKVFRVAAVYLAVGFVVLQVASLTFQPLGLPEWSYRLVLAVAVLGFPIALVLAWAFEIAPGEGVRRETGSGENSGPGGSEPA